MEQGRRFRKSTIKDVARYAGVSTTTVSVFVSGRESVCSPETAARIREAVAALNYTPSSLISGVQTRATRTFGACMRSPLDPILLYGNLFYERLWRGLLAECDAADYSLLHYPASVREAGGDRVDAFLDGRVDGLIFHAHENDRPARTAAAGMPTVLLTRSLNLPEGCGAAFADESRTADLALSHLWERGHRRIAHVAGPVGHDDHNAEPGVRGRIAEDDIAVCRLSGYETWLRTRRAFRPELIAYSGDWRREEASAFVAAWRALPEPPTAVFCANDALALAVLRSAREAGWRVPQDLSILGVDDAAAARAADPPLTSVEVRLEDIGREGVRCLLRLMQGAPIEECRVALPVSLLVERATVADAPAP